MADTPLNLIVLVSDTFRADHIGCFGNERIKTPCLDRLASEGTAFTNVYADGLPTIPERRVLFTGNSIIPSREHGGWRPLSPDDVTLPNILRENGYTTSFFTDVYHYFKPGMNFHEGFNAWEWIRGQENDPYRSGPRNSVDPRHHMPEHLWHDGKQTHRMFESCDERMRQYLMNTIGRENEEDYHCARTLRAAMTWLEQNMNNPPFMMFVDIFDPHEPWDAPPRFQNMYHDSIPFERYLFGYGMDFRDIRPEDYDILRALYAAEVTFVDMWIGRFCDRLEELGLRDNTIIFFTTDHGTHLGEEGCFTKTAGLLNSCIARLPLIIRHPEPGFRGARIDTLASSTDYMPTLLDMLGIDNTYDTDGTSLFGLMKGETGTIHERVFTEFGPFAAVHTDDWHYFQHTQGDDQGKGPALYDLQTDPDETRNVADTHEETVEKMRGYLEEKLGYSLP